MTTRVDAPHVNQQYQAVGNGEARGPVSQGFDDATYTEPAPVSKQGNRVEQPYYSIASAAPVVIKLDSSNTRHSTMGGRSNTLVPKFTADAVAKPSLFPRARVSTWNPSLYSVDSVEPGSVARRHL
jgi:hypothetical protein